MTYLRRRKTPACTCGAYPFPHRKGGGKCDANVPPEYRGDEAPIPEPGRSHFTSQADYNAARRQR